MGSETGITAYWTNLGCLRSSLVLNTSAKSKLTFWYNYMTAIETIPASSVFSGKGKSRGHLMQGRFDYTLNKNVSTYVLLDYLLPGDVYVQKDAALFFRTELQIKF